MGEYLTTGTTQYKLGTCESLYYTRYRELKKKRHIFMSSGDGTPADFLKPDTYRFRFPFPDEDLKFRAWPIQQEIADYNRGFMLRIPNTYKVEIGHGTFFTRHEKTPVFGFKTDCPMKEGATGTYFRWENEGYNFFEVVAQKPVMHDGVFQLQTVCRCPVCGEMSRLDLEEVEEVERWARVTNQGDETKEIVARMKAGYFIENEI